MKNIKNFILAAAVLLAGTSNAQKWSEGKDLSYLKGEKELILKFTYDNMTAGKKKSESEYIKEKSEEYNKKEAGKGDSWAKAWQENKAAIYEPKFEELFNKASGENLSADRKKSNTKYTVIIHTLRMEPGWNIGISKMPASCDFEIMIVETANPSVIKSKGMMYNVPGSQFSGYDFDVSSRIKECYAKCGKDLGKKLGKACKSK
jgi:hypothetical protein